MSFLNMSFSAAVLILVIVVIRALLLHKLPKKTFLALWGVALCRLLIPFTIPSPFSIYSIANTLNDKFPEADLPSFVPPVTPSAPNNPFITEIGSGLPGAALANLSPFTIIWLIGLLTCALFFLVTHLRCRREYKTALPIDNTFVRLWLKEHPLRRKVEIRQSDRISAPLTYGIFRPIVVLPKQVVWVDETRLRYILTHEYVHIRRWDTLAKLVLAAAVCVHWFNPFVWLMVVQANHDIELSCDEEVVKSFDKMAKSTYAATLITLEEKRSRLTPLANNFSKHAIEERIVSIVTAKKTSFRGILLAIVLVIATASVFATNVSPDSIAAADDELRNALQTGNVKITSISDVATFDHAEKAIKAVDYVPDYVESFSKGFYLKEAVITNTELQDSDNNKVAEYEGLVFYYNTKKKDAHTYGDQCISLTTSLEIFDLQDVGVSGRAEERFYRECRLIYSQTTSKYVPEGYVVTEEDQQKMDQGLLYINSGYEEIKDVQSTDYQFVKWIKDGIVYLLADNGCSIQKDILLEMAEEVIDCRR